MLLLKKRDHLTPDILHISGIGGIGMSGIAEILYNMGFAVQGSDICENANTQRLRNIGVKVFKQQTEQNIQHASFVIISSAIKPDNQEVMGARKLQIPVISRSQMLAELMRLKCSVAVSGSHGKTTTTSLVATLFESAHLSPTVINGGIINNKATNAYLGSGDFLVAEADESDATFIKIPATIAIITNIDPEHMDYYKDFNSLRLAFRTFINNLPFYGFAVLCIDHVEVAEIAREIVDRKIITYGINSADANVRAVNIRSSIYSSVFDLIIKMPSSENEICVQNIILPIAGKHNVQNCLAAIATGVGLGFDKDIYIEGFSKFAGVKRRFCKIGEFRNSDIIDDYAHHPEEIKATLGTAANYCNENKSKLLAIFQPHRYSRLRDLLDDFAKCFTGADQVVILDVFAAGEQAIEGVNSPELVRLLTKNNVKAVYASNDNEMEKYTREFAEKYQKTGAPNLILMMGAGSITYKAAAMAKNLQEEELKI